MEAHYLKINPHQVLLHDILISVLKEQEGHVFYDQFDQIIRFAQLNDLEALADCLENLPVATMALVNKALLHFLDLANLADQKKTNPSQLALADLIQNHGAKRVFSSLCDLDIQLVLTAHPTELRRRCIIEQQHAILDCLDEFETASKSQQAVIQQKIQEQISILWQMNRLNDHNPTPLDEVESGLAVVRKSLWNVMPKWIDALETQVQAVLGKNLPLKYNPIRFGSWIGGDRDGNAQITAQITQTTIMRAYAQAIELYEQALNDSYQRTQRVEFKPILVKLANTKTWVLQCLKANQWISKPDQIYCVADDLLSDLTACNQNIKNELKDLIRRVHCFGLFLMKLDIREHAKKHRDFFERCCPSYTTWNESEKCDFLIQALSKSEKKQYNLGNLKQDQAVWDYFCMLKQQPCEALNVYIISMTEYPSDILLVLFLQQQAGMKSLLPVVPLLETEQALNKAVDLLEPLFKNPWYLKFIKGKQEVMIGYSDPCKETGFLAASWQAYCAQQKLVALGLKYQVQIHFFQGRGGSVCRGGGSIEELMLAQPPKSLEGALRVTQQGEVIQNQFGRPELAFQSVSAYFMAVLKARLQKDQVVDPKWVNTMDCLAEASKQGYQSVVYEQADFLRFFERVTPIQGIGQLKISSRPIHRGLKTTPSQLHALRAIPWIFAWTQNRLFLPAWLGLAKALGLQAKHWPMLVQMKDQWPFFRQWLYALEHIFAQTDFEIWQYYQSVLLEDAFSKWQTQLNHDFQAVQALLSRLTDSKSLALFGRRRLDLVVLNIIQVIVLSRLQRSKSKEPLLEQLLLINLMGIAAGMRNTG